jgi:hypothetical protein
LFDYFRNAGNKNGAASMQAAAPEFKSGYMFYPIFTPQQPLLRSQPPVLQAQLPAQATNGQR